MPQPRSYDRILVDIVEYVYHYQINKPSSFHRARLLLLDSFGCAMESLHDDAVKMIIGPHVPGTVVPNGFRLPGTAMQLDPVKGAFDFATMIRYLDHNDALGGVEWGHPSDNLGAIVAAADWSARSSTCKDNDDEQATRRGPALNIRTLLTAMIKAYEIQGCFQAANSFNAVGIDHTILVKVASTAVISWLFGLSEVQALAALSQAWMDGHPLRTFRAAPNTVSRKGWAAGDACMRAVHLVLLTRAGQAGSLTPLTAPRWGFYACLFRDKEFSLPVPYSETIIHQAVFKLIACEGHALTAAQAALELSDNARLAGIDLAQNTESIEVRTQLPALTIIDKTGELHNAADRDHCMQYVIAVILLKGSLIEPQDYQNHSPWASDPRVTDLRNKMTLQEDKSFTRDYYDRNIRSAATSIKTTSTNGSWSSESTIHFPLGHPNAVDTEEKVISKLRANVGSKFSEEEIKQLQSELENDELPIQEYVDLWARSEDSAVQGSQRRGQRL